MRPGVITRVPLGGFSIPAVTPFLAPFVWHLSERKREFQSNGKSCRVPSLTAAVAPHLAGVSGPAEPGWDVPAAAGDGEVAPGPYPRVPVPQGALTP